MTSDKDAALIVNTKSRRGNELYSIAKNTLLELGLNLVSCAEATRSEDVVAKTRETFKQGIPLVIIGGGDGTLSGAVGEFVGSQSTLGVLPLGTGNEFARDLGIGPDIKAACKVIVEGRVVETDVGTIADSYFLNVATVGITVRIAQGLRKDEKRRFGRMAYLFALVRGLARARPFRATLTVPGAVHTFETLQVVIGNGRYHAGPFPVAPDATITDGTLSAYALATASRWGLLRFALNLPGGHHVTLDDVFEFKASTIQLETSPSQRVVADGEIKYTTPLEFGIVPASLRVMVPQDSPVKTSDGLDGSVRSCGGD